MSMRAIPYFNIFKCPPAPLLQVQAKLQRCQQVITGADVVASVTAAVLTRGSAAWLRRSAPARTFKALI